MAILDPPAFGVCYCDRFPRLSQRTNFFQCNATNFTSIPSAPAIAYTTHACIIGPPQPEAINTF